MENWGGPCTIIVNVYALWSFFHPPNETNLRSLGSDDECGNVQLVKTRELNVVASLGQNLTLGNCRQDFTVLWLYQWFPTNLKQSMHKTLTLGPLSLPLARDANVCPMVPSLHPVPHIHNYCWVFNYCLCLEWQAGMLLWWFYLFLPFKLNSHDLCLFKGHVFYSVITFQCHLFIWISAVMKGL